MGDAEGDGGRHGWMRLGWWILGLMLGFIFAGFHLYFRTDPGFFFLFVVVFVVVFVRRFYSKPSPGT
jgi:uncharacterized membrane protein YgaE (UPF0421/DUF939 family)